MPSLATVCANVLEETTGKNNLPGARISLLPMFSSLNYKVDQQADLQKTLHIYLFKKKKINNNKKSICRHVFSCPATPTAFSASRGFCAPEACVSACACCSARKGLAVMAPWPWLWAPGSRLLMGS